MFGDSLETAALLDVSELRRESMSERLVSQLRRPWVYALAQAVCPSVRLGGFVLVTRFDDVQNMLEDDHSFEVEGWRIERGNRGHGFLLGMQDDRRCPFYQPRTAGDLPSQPPLSYRDYQNLVMRYFPLQDLPQVTQRARHAAEQALRAQPRRARVELDAVQRLITHVPLELCRSYYGVDMPDGAEVSRWTFMISRWLFDPAASSRFDKIGLTACERLNQLIEQSIDRLGRNEAQHAGETVIGRMLRDGVDRQIIRVIIFGMIVGFVPTNTMAGGHMLEMLLKHPEFLSAAASAARADDDEGLKRCVFEAMRFKPLLREPLRLCRRPYKFSDGLLPGVECKPGERVIAMVSCAVMDHRRFRSPTRFDPERDASDGLLFGYGLHRCIGAPIAEAQIVQTLKPLLRQRGLRAVSGRRGKLQTIGPFPEHLFVQFDAAE